MNEYFQFDGRLCAHDLFQFGKCGLTLQNHAGKSEILCKGESCGIVQSHLGRTVQHELRKIFARNPHDSEILHDDGIRPQFLQTRELLRRLVKLILLDERVERDIDAPGESVRIRDQARHLVKREIFGPFARVEAFQAAVDGIRPRVKRGKRAFQISRRCQ